MTDTQELGRRVVDEAIQLQRENAVLREGMLKLVRAAYNEGFTEGMKEHTHSRGGKPWRESDAYRTLQTIGIVPAS